MRRARTAAIVLLVVLSLTIAGCGKGGGDAITVGSKIDTEGGVLGQMVIVLLEENGYEVVDKTKTGTTDVVRQALVAGEIDIYVEYTGTAFNLFFPDEGLDTAISKDAGLLYDTVKRLDGEQNDVVWLGRSPANNTWAIAIPFGLAEEFQMGSLEDWAAWINEGNEVKLVCSQEFVDRADGLAAFEDAYGFDLNSEDLIILAGGDTAQTEAAAAQGTNGANAAMAYGTDGSIAALDLWVLDDPLGVQPYYQPAPTIRKDVLDAHPDIADILDPVFADLTLETLQELNKKVAVDGLDPATVARDYLKEKGLIG